MSLPPQWARVTLAMSSPQRNKFYNVFYYVPTSGIFLPGQEQANILATAALAVLTTHLPEVLTTQDVEARLLVQYYDSEVVWETTIVQDITGTITSDQLPDFVAACILKRAASPGKSGRGRWFFGQVAETLTDENYL